MVSVLVPCYNHEKYIEECLKSLIDQDYRDIELIIYDDCSSDNSFSIIQKWEKQLNNRFNKVVIHRNCHNLGVVKNLNAMIEIAQGEYIKPIASDDMLLSNAISTFMKATESSDADVYFSNVAFVSETTKYQDVNIEKLLLRYSEKPLEGKNLTGQLCADNFICAPGAFIPKKTFEQYGTYDEKYCLEDFEFWLRVSVSGCIKYIDSVTALYRQNENSLSRFDMSEKSIIRHQKFSRDKISIFSKYENYATHEQAEQFFNSELDSSIGTNDKAMMNEIIRKMNEKKLKISFWNRLRIIAINLNIYPFLKRIKYFIKR